MTDGVTTDAASDGSAVNKNMVDGRQIIHREQARLFTPYSKYPERLSPVYGVDKVVLDDGRVVFQCVHPDPPLDCEYFAEKGESVRSHLRVHTLDRKLEEQRAIKDERDALLAKQKQRWQNYQDGAKKAALTRKQNRELRKNGDDNGNGNNNESYPSTVDVSAKINGTQAMLKGMIDGLEKVATIMQNMSKTAINVAANLDDLGSVKFVNDPEIASKAEQWDALQGLLRGNDKNTR